MDINTHSTLKTSLAAYWTLDTNFNDSHSGARHGTFYNTPTFPVAKLRTGAKFVAASSQYGKVTNHADFQGATMTFAFWFKVDALPASTQWLLGHSEGGLLNRNVQLDSGGTVSVTFPDAVLPVTVPSTSPIVAGRWYHLLAFQGSGVVAFYLNNVDQGTIPSFTPAGVSADIYLGSNPTPGQYFNGIIDDFGWWNKILSSDERNDLYQSGIGITWDGTFNSIKTHPTLRSGMIAHYKLDGNPNDTLGNYNGTLVGNPAPTYVAGKIGQATSHNAMNYVSVANAAALNPATVSVVGWVSPSSWSGRAGVITKGLGGPYAVYIDSGNVLTFYYKTAGGAAWVTRTFTWGAWNFFAGTWDGVTAKFSINNGAVATSTSYPGDLSSNTSILYLASGWEDTLNGKIDELALYNRPLVASEITDLYNSGNGLIYEYGLPSAGSFTSVQSGAWSDPATWGAGSYPGDGSTVTISAGHTVTIDGSHTVGTAPTDDTTMVLTINDTGWLKWTDNPTSSWTFTIKGNVNIVKGGKFSVGTASVPIPAAQTATVYFPSVNTTGWKIQANGTLEAYGAEAYHMASTSMQRSKLVWNMTTGTGVSLKVADAVDWQVGDTVSISNMNAPASVENLVIQSKIDAYTYTVNTTSIHLIDDFAVLVNRNVKFLGYDNAGRGVSIYASHSSATAAVGTVINLSWCSLKYFGRGVSTTLGTQALYYFIFASNPVGSSIPDANFKLIGVVFDELSNNSPEGTIYFNSDIPFNGTSYRLDGVHFVTMNKKAVYVMINGVTKLRGVSATYIQGATGQYTIFGRWGNLIVDGLFSCVNAGGTTSVWGFASLVTNCHFCGPAYGVYFIHINSGNDNYAYMMVNEAVVDTCKFVLSSSGVIVAQNNPNCFGMTHNVYVKNCEFFGTSAASAVMSSGQAGRIRVENCTIDGVGSSSSPNLYAIQASTEGAGPVGCTTDVVVAGCTVGRIARMPIAMVGYDGLSPNMKVSVVGCDVYQPWYITSNWYQDWLYSSLFRFASYHEDAYDYRWRTSATSAASAVGCRIWLGDGSGRNELFSMVQRYRRLVLGAGSEMRDQLTNIDTGKMPLRLIPFSACANTDLNKRTPIKIDASPNKRITASLKFKNIGTSQRLRAGMRLYGAGILSKAKMTAAAGVWQTLTVQGDCNPTITTRGVKYISGLVGYWTLNQTMNDSHTNALHGTCPFGTASYTTCKFGYGFDTGGSVLTVKLSSGALVNPANFTICAWLYVGTVTGAHVRAVVSKDCDELASLRSYAFGVSNGNWFAGVATAGGWDSVTGPAASTDSMGTYRFVAMSYDGTTIRLCFNGMVYSKVHAYPGNAQVNSTVPMRFASVSRRGWAEKTYSTKPSGRIGTRMVFDSARGVCVLFGGATSGLVANAETWEYNGSSWTQRSPGTSPPARYNHALAFDPVRNVTVLHGGTSTGSNYLTDTWEYDGTNWTQKSPSTVPSGRYYHGMVYDGNIAKTLMYGGIISGGRSSQTYTWNGTDWTLLTPASNPGTLSQFGLAFDSTRNVTVLFGGYSGSSYMSGTWEYNGTNWVDKSIALGQYDAPAACFYPPKNVVVGSCGTLVGVGMSRNSYLYDGTAWRSLILENPPVARMNHAMAYDSARGKVVIFGGQSTPTYGNDTWEYPEAVDGYATYTETWNGSIDEVSLFNRALAPSELLLMYGKGRGLRYDEASSYLDTTQVNLVLTSGSNNADWRDRSYTEAYYPGRVLYSPSRGPTGLQDTPVMKIAVDVDTLTITESSIP